MAILNQDDKRLVVPKATTTILIVPVVALCITGVLALQQYNFLPAGTVLDAAFILSAVLLSARLDRRVNGILLLLSLYLAIRIGLMLYLNPVNLEDFIQANKAFAYLILLVPFVGKRFQRPGLIANLTRFVLTAAIVKYAVARIASSNDRISDRPGMFQENNYEIALFCGLVAIAYPYLGSKKNLYFWLLVAIVGLSGSRSGAASLVIVYIYLYFGSGPTSKLARMFRLFGIIAFGALATWIFESRLTEGGIESLDRYRFLQAFLRDTADWDGLNYLFGTLPITPMSVSTCHEFVYYQDLFSNSGDSSCYSVILHSFLLRIIFDAGILGLVATFGATWYLLRLARVPRSLSLCLLGLAAANAVSVSGLNNIFVILPVALAMLAAKRGPEVAVPRSEHQAQAPSSTQRPGIARPPAP